MTEIIQDADQLIFRGKNYELSVYQYSNDGFEIEIEDRKAGPYSPNSFSFYLDRDEAANLADFLGEMLNKNT